MKIYKYIIWIAVICTSLFAACSDEERGPVVSDSTIPGNVSNVQVERLPGAIKLKYDLPNDQALAYVKAECVMNGIKREVKSSAYNNNLIIQGFPDTCSYQINLYSVNRSEVVNPSPVTLSAKPLNPPFQDVYKSLSREYCPLLVYRSSGYSEGRAVTAVSGQGHTCTTGQQQAVLVPAATGTIFVHAPQHVPELHTLVTAHPACRVVFRVASPEGVKRTHGIRCQRGFNVRVRCGVHLHLKHGIAA